MADSSTPSATAFRISEIPSSITKPALLAALSRVLSPAASFDASLAPCPYDHARFQVATLTFRSVPAVLLPCCGGRGQVRLELHIGDDTVSVSADTGFLGLTPLNDGPTQHDVDLIFITGLAGHAFGSWKAHRKQQMWVREFLAADLADELACGVRILTYGYDSTLLASTSNAGIAEFARAFLETLKNARRADDAKHRPIVFVAHSLGGIVVKQALVDASTGSPRDQAVLTATYACIFLGVPNRGLDVSQLAAMVKGQRNERLVADLGLASQQLSVLHDAFGAVFTYGDSRVISIFETKLSRTVQRSPSGTWRRTGPLIEMVAKTSAVFATPHEARHDQLSRNSDHSGLAKFDSRADAEYVVLRGRIAECVACAAGVVAVRFAVLDDVRGGESPAQRVLGEREAWDMVERHRMVQMGEVDFRDVVARLKPFRRARDGRDVYLESAVVEAVYAAVGAGR